MRKIILLSICFIFIAFNLIRAQTVLLSPQSGSFPDTDGPITDSYNLDVSKCTSIQLSFDFFTPDIWIGSGANNLEPQTDCPGCADLPGDVPSLDCEFCWDYLYIEINNSGTVEWSIIYGLDDATPTSESVTTPAICIQPGTTSMDINVIGQTWAGDEDLQYSNLTVLCWEAAPMPATTDVCPNGGDVDLLGSACNNNDVVSWDWNGPGSITNSAAQNTMASNSFPGDIYTLTTTDINGCTASSDITVAASAGVPTFEITASSQPSDEVCYCGQIDFLLDNIGLLTGYDIDWESSDGQTGTGFNPFWPGSVTGTYFAPCDPALVGSTLTFNVTVTDQSTLCTGTDDYVVTIVDGGDADISAVDVDICEGEDIILSELSGSGGDSWIWSGPNGFSSNLQNPTIIGATIDATGMYFVTVSDDDGNFCQSEDMIDITVNPSSTVSLNGGGGLCRGGCLSDSGSPISFSSTGLSGLVDVEFAIQGIPITLPGIAIDISGILEICWNEPGLLPAFSGNTLNLPLDNPLLGPGTYQFDLISVMQAGNECITIVPPSSVSITLAENPALDLVAPMEVCEGDNIIFEDLITDPNVISWNWDGPNGYTNNQAPPQIILGADPNNTGTYNLTVTDFNGCTNSSSVDVQVVQAPIIDETVIITGCEDEFGNVTYNLTSFETLITGGIPYTFTWFETAAMISPIVNPSGYTVQNTVVPVFATVSDGNCSIFAQFNMMPIPRIPLSLDIVPFEVCSGQMVTITELINDPDILNWFWDDMETTSGSGSTPFLVIDSVPPLPVTQTYTLTVQDINGCFSAESITFDVNTTPIAGIPDTIIDCDIDMDGMIDFDLSSTINILTNGNTDLDVNWYTDVDGINGVLTPNPISVSPTTLYASVSNDSNCESELVPVTFEFTTGADLGAPLIPNSCEFVILPPITPGSPSSLYYEMQDGMGTSYMPGDTITAIGQNTLFVFDQNPCFTGNDAVNFEIYVFPESTADSLIVACDSVQIGDYPFNPVPQLVLSDTLYLTALDGTGDTIMPGSWVDSSLVLYSILETPACFSIDSTIIEISQTPRVGKDSTISICNGLDQEFDLMAILENPDTNGTWIGLDIIPDSNDSTAVNFIGLPEGISSFTYQILSENCGLFSSVVNIEVLPAQFAGMPNSIQVCNGNLAPNSAVIDLELLASDMNLGMPDPNGIWTELTLSGVDISDINNVDFTGVSAGSYEFEYLLNNSAADFCSEKRNIVTVIVLNQPTAGDSVMISTCIGDIIDLDEILLNADTIGGNGFFNNISPVILSPGNVFNTIGTPAGVYEFEYIIPDGQCPGDRALISVELTLDVSAGDDQSTIACGLNTINLLELLDPAAAVGGVFTDLSGDNTISGNTFDPLQANSFITTIQYVVGQSGNCGSDTSLLELELVSGSVNITGSVITQLCNNECASALVTLGNENFPSDFILQVSLPDGSSFSQNYTNVVDNVEFLICHGAGANQFQNDTLMLIDDIGTYEFSIENASNEICSMLNTSGYQYTLLESPITNINQSLCLGENVTVGNQIFDENNPTGQVVVNTVNGCDSTINVNLSFFPEATFDLIGSRCQDDVVMVGTDIYDENNPIGISILPNMSSNGCDSTVNVNLVFEAFATEIINDVYCSSDIVTINGIDYTAANPSGQDTLVGASIAGCDSLLIIDLVFENFPMGFESPIICAGDELNINGTDYNINNPSGQDTLFNASVSGCDSIVMVALSFFPVAEGNLTLDDICADLTVTIGDTDFSAQNSSGIATINNGSINGCDSIVNVVVNFVPNEPTLFTVDICQGEDFISPNNNIYNESNPSGIESVGIGINGCDSLVNYQISVLPNSFSDIMGSFCNGDQIVVNNNTYDIDTPVGMEVLMGLAANGCDSIVNINLSFDRSYDFSVLEPCEGGELGTVTLENNVGTELPVTISSQDGQTFVATGIPFTFDLPEGINLLELIDVNGCRSTQTVVVPNAQSGPFGISQTSTAPNTYELTIETDINYNTLNWSPSSIIDCLDPPSCEQIAVTVTEDTELIASIEYGESCTRSDTILLEIDRTIFIYLANVFSPNGDFVNDNFYIQINEDYIDEVTVAEFKIYDRWGSLVFQNDDANPNIPEDGWDGTFLKSSGSAELVESGVYVYMIVLRVEGETDDRIFKGDITVVR